MPEPVWPSSFLPAEKRIEVNRKAGKIMAIRPNQGALHEYVWEIYNMYARGNSCELIAEKYSKKIGRKISRESIYNFLRKYGLNIRTKDSEEFRKNKVNIVSEKLRITLQEITEQKIKKLDGDKLINAARQLNKIERLELGKSTQNVAINVLLEQEKNIDNEIKQLAQKYGIDEKELKDVEAEVEVEIVDE